MARNKLLDEVLALSLEERKAFVEALRATIPVPRNKKPTDGTWSPSELPPSARALLYQGLEDAERGRFVDFDEMMDEAERLSDQIVAERKAPVRSLSRR